MVTKLRTSMDGFQITTVYENTIRISHGVGNICGGQSKTTVERIPFDAGH